MRIDKLFGFLGSSYSVFDKIRVKNNEINFMKFKGFTIDSSRDPNQRYYFKI